MPRSGRLLGALFVALAATAATTSALRPISPSALPTGLAVAANVESTALYCTGLTDAGGGVAGSVVFLNTGSRARQLTVMVVASSGRSATSTVRLAAHATASIRPDQLVTGHEYAVAALIDGGGVVAFEVTAGATSEIPCAASGVTDWYASGLDTSVGSSALLSFYNPTATPAVVDVTAFTAGGFVAPAPFQGLPVPAHAVVALNLGSQIVNQSHVGVRVRVVRGALVVAGVEHSGTVGSLDVGATAPALSATFARVTTVDGARAEVRLANPGNRTAAVTLTVSLGAFSVPVISATVEPFATAVVTITPNSAIPAAGYATVTLTSSEPVVATLAAGPSGGVGLTPAPAPGGLFLLADLAHGFDAVAVTNTSSRTVTVVFPRGFVLGRPGVTLAAASARLAPHATVDLVGIDAGLSTLSGVVTQITCARPVLVVSATLPSTPAGAAVVSLLDGG